MNKFPFRPEPPPVLTPPWWARGRHIQTLAGHFLKSNPPEPPWERLSLKLPDGDALRVKLFRGSSDTVVYLFHGLGGNTDKGYMRRMAALFHAKGHSILAANHRGAGEGRGLAERPYHSGSTADLAAVIQVGRGFFPEYRHVAIGFSLSGNMLLLLLGRDRDSGLAMPDNAIAVNAPVELEKTSLRLLEGFNRVYDHHFVKRLLEETKDRWELGLHTELLRPKKVKTLRDFDEAFTAPRAGFRNRSDYYARCSCGPHLANIRIPTVILCSEDDPLTPVEDFYAFPRSKFVHLHVERYGGHMGYIASDVPGHRWMDLTLDHFVEEFRHLET